MRVLFVIPSPVGGTVQYTHNLANALVDLGHEVLVATAIDFELKPFARRYDVVEVFDGTTPHPGRFAALLRAVRRLSPQVIHFQGAQHPEFYLLMWSVLRPFTGARFVWTPQDVLSNARRPWHMKTYRAVYRRMEHVFLNARQNAGMISDYFGVTPDRVTVLPIPDLVAFARDDLVPEPPNDVPPGRRLVLCFGLIEPRKGIDTLIDAFAHVRARAPEAFLLVVGKALTDVEPYRQAITRHGLEADARIVDRYATFAELVGLFRTAHVVTLPYHQGWNSGVLATAFGFGKPVVVTAVGGFDEVVASGHTGLVVPPRDPVALADALVAALTDPDLYGRMAAAAAVEGTKASWQAVATTTAEAYRRLSGGNNALVGDAA